MKNLSILIPVHKFNETIGTYLRKALKSVPQDVKTYIVCPDETRREIIKDDFFSAFKNWVTVNGETDFCSMVNTGVESCDTEYFSILELDDCYTPNFITSMLPYIEVNEPDTKVFLSIQELYDATKDGEPVGYINETAWASAFSDEIGFLDIESLEAYYNFNTTGAIINTAFFKKIGGLKPSIKISFWYEFLLRCIYNQGKVYVVPKVCYQHTVNRLDSLTTEYTETISQEEGAWWIELAQEEYFFNEDRKKTYPKKK